MILEKNGILFFFGKGVFQDAILKVTGNFTCSDGTGISIYIWLKWISQWYIISLFQSHEASGWRSSISSPSTIQIHCYVPASVGTCEISWGRFNSPQLEAYFIVIQDSVRKKSPTSNNNVCSAKLVKQPWQTLDESLVQGGDPLSYRHL